MTWIVHALNDIKAGVRYFQENEWYLFFPPLLIEVPFSQKYVTLTVTEPLVNTKLLLFPMFPFDPPENVFRCFQGDQKGALPRREG